MISTTMVYACKKCQDYFPSQPKEPQRPFQKVATDLLSYREISSYNCGLLFIRTYYDCVLYVML